jgi:surface protein
MFDGCRDLKKLEFGKNFNTENVRNMRCMFEMCSSLKNLDLLNFNTLKVKNKGNMFDNCNSLPQDTIKEILGKKK